MTDADIVRLAERVGSPDSGCSHFRLPNGEIVVEWSQRALVTFARHVAALRPTCGTCAYWTMWPDVPDRGTCAAHPENASSVFRPFTGWERNDGCIKGWTPKETP
jgi:hypothetical protein